MHVRESPSHIEKEIKHAFYLHIQSLCTSACTAQAGEQNLSTHMEIIVALSTTFLWNAMVLKPI